MNTTFANNLCIWGSSLFIYSGSNINIINSIMWNDSIWEIYFTPYDGQADPAMIPDIHIFNSNILGGEDLIATNGYGALFWEEGNIDSPPLFTDPENGDYTLQESSPCIDAGTPFFVWEGDTLINMNQEEYYGSAPDMGAYEFDPTMVIEETQLPNEYRFSPAYPNPFNPLTTIEFDVPVVETGHAVALRVFDLRGRLVETLIKETLLPGHYSVKWDGTNHTSGVYFIRMEAGSGQAFNQTQKVLLLK